MATPRRRTAAGGGRYCPGGLRCGFRLDCVSAIIRLHAVTIYRQGPGIMVGVLLAWVTWLAPRSLTDAKLDAATQNSYFRYSQPAGLEKSVQPYSITSRAGRGRNPGQQSARQR